jgi:hypothetical protein
MTAVVWVAALVCVAGMLGAMILLPPTVRGVSSTVVISEFRVRGPVGGSDEFVELYNLSSSTVNIGGWLIRGSNSSGTVSTRVTIAAGTMLGPGCHFLATNSSSSGGPYSGAVAGNQTYGTGITDDGGIALTLPDLTVVDAVGLSTGSAYGEGTRLASLGGSNLDRSYERLPGGTSGSGTDTDNNAADFALISPSQPQNLASPCITSGSTDPSGVGAANPSAVSPGGSSVLTVTVTPGTGPASTGLAVSADLSGIGGLVSQPFYDDGIQGGDALPNDNVFTFTAPVSPSTAPGNVSLPFTITDAQSRTGSGSISLGILAPLTPIHDIQGSGNTSPYNGQTVRTRGIVTAVKFNGFFVQTADSDADGDANTSQGIFVFSPVVPLGAAVGNQVDVTGMVQEFASSADPFSPAITELATATVSVVSTGNALPAPVVLTAADTDPAGGLDVLERFEFMRVSVASLTVVGPTDGSVTESSATANSNGVFYGVIAGVARPFREPGVQVPDALPAGSPCCVPRFDLNPERLRVDSDGQTGAARIEVTSGATVSNITGVLDYGFRTWTILPDPAPAPGVSGNVTFAAVPAPGANEFTVATMNLERFFDTVNDPGIGDPVLTGAAFANRLNKVSLSIRNALNLPDIIGLQEVENLSTLQALATQVNNDVVAGGGADPLYTAYLDEGNDPGGIDVGFLVKSSRVVVHSTTQEGKFATYIDPNTNLPATLNDRPPLRLQATVLSTVGPDQPVTVIVAHQRSLLSIDDPVDGHRVRTKRAAQAEFLANLIQSRQAADANEWIVVVGDFNAFEFSDGYADTMGTTIGAPAPANEVVLASPDLVNPNLVDLVTQALALDRYSYVFDGHAQTLDHVLVNAPAYAKLSRFHTARVNADFPETMRNDATRPERYSDHDHPVVYFALPPIIVSIDVVVNQFPNIINLNFERPVTVAILSTPTFDASQVDPRTVTLSGAGVRTRPNGNPVAGLDDANRDGLRDLIIQIERTDLNLVATDTEAVLQGMTFSGKFVRGKDSVVVIPRGQ